MSTALNPLVTKIRGAHPGAYDDMDDAALTKAVLKKYPQYSDLAAPPASAAPGGPATQPMAPSHLAESLNPATSTRSAIANPQQPAEQFGLDNPEQQGKLATSAAIGAAGTALPEIAPSIGRLATKHPVLTNIAGTTAISQARRIPYVGKFIPPFAEMLPWMRGGGAIPEEPSLPPAVEQGPRFPSGNMRATEGEYVDTPPSSAPSAPPIAPSEVIRPRALPSSASPARDLPYRRGPGEIATEDVNAPDPSVLAGRQGVRVPPKSTPKLLSAPPAPVARGIAKPEPLAEPIPRSEWPPPEPKGVFDKPVASPRGISDLRDDEAVREGIRERVGQADRKVFASQRERNDVSVPKGVLTGEINKPAKLTSGKSNGSRGVGVTTPETDDLTPILKKSLAAARKGKKGD